VDGAERDEEDEKVNGDGDGKGRPIATMTPEAPSGKKGVKPAAASVGTPRIFLSP
jgi:hypothetical protein